MINMINMINMIMMLVLMIAKSMIIVMIVIIVMIMIIVMITNAKHNVILMISNDFKDLDDCDHHDNYLLSQVTFQRMTIPNHYIWLYNSKKIMYMVK